MLKGNQSDISINIKVNNCNCSLHDFPHDSKDTINGYDKVMLPDILSNQVSNPWQF